MRLFHFKILFVSVVLFFLITSGTVSARADDVTKNISFQVFMTFAEKYGENFQVRSALVFCGHLDYAGIVAPNTEASLSIIKDIMESMPDYSELDNSQQTQVNDSVHVALAAYDYGLSSQHPLKSWSEKGCAKALELAPTLIQKLKEGLE